MFLVRRWSFYSFISLVLILKSTQARILFLDDACPVGLSTCSLLYTYLSCTWPNVPRGEVTCSESLVLFSARISQVFFLQLSNAENCFLIFYEAIMCSFCTLHKALIMFHRVKCSVKFLRGESACSFYASSYDGFVVLIASKCSGRGKC
jgi:hypothetical protein